MDARDFNVISIMSLTTILVRLTNGLICMFKVIINVCCAFGFGMMILINGVLELLKGSTLMEPIDCMCMC